MNALDVAGILELTMLVCFGAAWPASIFKSWRSRTARGKSIFFLGIIFTGYIAGISKTVITEGAASFMMIPYVTNAVMVMTDILIYLRNVGLDRTEDARRTREKPPE